MRSVIVRDVLKRMSYKGEGNTVLRCRPIFVTPTLYSHKPHLQSLRLISTNKAYHAADTASGIPDFIPPPPEIVDSLSNGVQVLNALGEPTLHSLGLAANTPTGLVQSLIETLHVSLDIPWFAAIIGTTFCLRTFLLPVTIIQIKNSVNMSNHMPISQKLQAQAMQAARNGDHDAMAKQAECMEYLKRNKINPIRMCLTMLMSAPVFVSVFWGLKGMTGLPVEGLMAGGAYWFMDLTLRDPYLLLPALSASSIWFALKTGAEGISTENAMGPMKWMSKVLPAIVFIACASQPTAVVVYWTTSNIISIIFGKILRSSYGRELFNIPESVIHPPEVYENVFGFGSGRTDQTEQITLYKRLAELQHEMKDREKVGALKFNEHKGWEPPKSLKSHFPDKDKKKE